MDFKDKSLKFSDDLVASRRIHAYDINRCLLSVYEYLDTLYDSYDDSGDVFFDFAFVFDCCDHIIAELDTIKKVCKKEMF